MSSRDEILRAVRRNKPGASPLPDPVPGTRSAEGLVERFTRVVRAIGGEVLETEDVAGVLRERYPDARRIGSTTPRCLSATVDLHAVHDPHELADLELLVCEGVVGVAENGAVWLPESRMVHRAAPFITQHLALVLERGSLVGDMADAYARIRADDEGYGVFVAGPSKTADIEQSLVIGAHGARSLLVLLV